MGRKAPNKLPKAPFDSLIHPEQEAPASGDIFIIFRGVCRHEDLNIDFENGSDDSAVLDDDRSFTSA